MSTVELRRDFERAGLELPEVIKTGKELGKGSYGAVFEVVLHGTRFAAKEIYSTIKRGERIKEYFFDECVYNSRLRHPNIVQLIGVHYPSPTDELPWLVMELMKRSLNAMIERCAELEGKDIPFHYKQSILVDVGQGLQFLHSKGIIHRDLSSNNVLLTKDYVAKIGDLGVAKLVDSQSNQKQTQAPGTVAFMPPEALQDDSQYGPSLDVFSLGCVCIHLVSLKWPTPEPWRRLDETTGKIVILATEFQRRQKYLAKFDQSPPELKILVEQCLNDWSKDRPNTGEVVERLRNIKCHPLPHENDDLLQLHTLLIDCEEELARCVREKDKELAKKNEELVRVAQQLAEKDRHRELVKKAEQLQNNEDMLSKKLVRYKKKLTENKQVVTQYIQQMKEKDEELARVATEKDQQLADKDQQLADKDQQLAEKVQQLEKKAQELVDKDKRIEEKDQQLAEKDQELTKQTNMLSENQRDKSQLEESNARISKELGLKMEQYALLEEVLQATVNSATKGKRSGRSANSSVADFQRIFSGMTVLIADLRQKVETQNLENQRLKEELSKKDNDGTTNKSSTESPVQSKQQLVKTENSLIVLPALHEANDPLSHEQKSPSSQFAWGKSQHKMEDKKLYSKLTEDSTSEVKSKEPLHSKNMPEMYPARAESLDKPKQKIDDNTSVIRPRKTGSNTLFGGTQEESKYSALQTKVRTSVDSDDTQVCPYCKQSLHGEYHKKLCIYSLAHV